MEISKITKQRIVELLDKKRRLDGRKIFEYRKKQIETNISKNAEGSCLVTLGKTKVMVGVKIDVGEPFPDTPEEGILIVNSELSPLASERFEMGPPGEKAIELARVVDRAIRESEFIDLKKLFIKENLVFVIFVDIYPINDDGNLIDASFLGAVEALENAKLPKIEDDKIVYGELTNKSLPLRIRPEMITFYKIGNHFLIDPTKLEEDASEGRISFAIQRKKEIKIRAVQKFGDALSVEEIYALIEKIKEIKGL